MFSTHSNTTVQCRSHASTVVQDVVVALSAHWTVMLSVVHTAATPESPT